MLKLDLILTTCLDYNPILHKQSLESSSNSTIRSAYEAVRAACSGGTFEEGMEEELKILTKLLKSKDSKGLQYHFFNNRRFDNNDTVDQSPAAAVKSYLMREKPLTNVPSDCKIVGDVFSPQSVAVWGVSGGGSRAVRVGKIISTSGISPDIIMVSAICTLHGCTSLYNSHFTTVEWVISD